MYNIIKNLTVKIVKASLFVALIILFEFEQNIHENLVCLYSLQHMTGKSALSVLCYNLQALLHTHDNFFFFFNFRFLFLNLKSSILTCMKVI